MRPQTIIDTVPGVTRSTEHAPAAPPRTSSVAGLSAMRYRWTR